jgi:dipeptidyl aminopeptidase/acylaminoacyl peptidase
MQWEGSLTFPPNYDPGRRYPLVVQTHGFQEQEFLVDGPYRSTTAFAAQALACSGFVVFQAGDNPGAWTLDEHTADNFADAYADGIQLLVRRDIADARHIGLIAFSHTGLAAVELLATHPDLLEAATIADAGWWGYVQNLLLFDDEGGPQILEQTGGVAPVEKLGAWLDMNPLYKIGKAKAAIRIEANGPTSLLNTWEHYVLLQRSNRPVEYIYFPAGSHNLRKPAERYASEQGNVDWYQFWLRGSEAGEPVLPGQYNRWRSLRERLRKHQSR